MMTRLCRLPRRNLTGLSLSARRGLTMMEIIVAVAIILTIMVGVVWSFVELLDSHDRARARMDATANARAAMEVLSRDIKTARNDAGNPGSFVGQTNSSPGGGDRFDDDGDGDVDEESLNGADDDGSWVLAQDDKHALLSSGSLGQYAERPVFYGAPDLNDGDIDEDLGATSATLEFDIFDSPGEPLNRHVRFYVGNDFEGTPHTLMREVTGVDPVTSTTVITSGPLCYNVQSFGLLFWNHASAKDSSANPWDTQWPPVTTGSLTVAPSTVYARISVYAGKPYTLDEVPADQVLEAVTLSTIVNVEAVLADPTYAAQRTPVPPIGSAP